MYLLDTNIWLERLLGQTHSEDVGQLLNTVPVSELIMTDFTLHSIGVILGRLSQREVFIQFVEDVLINGTVTLLALPPLAMRRVTFIMDQFGLDFDDAYQYVAAEVQGAILISFDGDFDRTVRGRKTPAQILS